MINSRVPIDRISGSLIWKRNLILHPFRPDPRTINFLYRDRQAIRIRQNFGLLTGPMVADRMGAPSSRTIGFEAVRLKDGQPLSRAWWARSTTKSAPKSRQPGLCAEKTTVSRHHGGLHACINPDRVLSTGAPPGSACIPFLLAAIASWSVVCRIPPHACTSFCAPQYRSVSQGTPHSSHVLWSLTIVCCATMEPWFVVIPASRQKAYILT